MIFFVSLLICIFLHELAHLIVAKACKCKVITYSIGFGKPVLWSKTYKGTKYQITPWIVGGYCELKDELNYSKSKYAFTNLSYRKKFAISVAGVVANVLTGFLALGIGILLDCFPLIYGGIVSITLGLSNILPIPALDGSYIFLVLLEKIYGKKKGYGLMNKICSISFKILLVLNLVCLPYLVYLCLTGRIL